MAHSRRILRAAVAAFAFALATATLGGSIASASSSTLWNSLIRDHAWVAALAVANDGTHHLLISDPEARGTSYYATDLTGAWTFTPVVGDPGDLALDADGNAWFVTLVDVYYGGDTNSPRLYNTVGGTVTGEDVPGGGFSNVAAIDIDAAGTVHVVWSVRSGESAWYSSYSAAGWSAARLIEMGVSPTGFDLNADTTVPMLYASGILMYPFDTWPGGCSTDPNERACTVAVSLTETPSVTGIGVIDPGGLDVAADASGHVHGVVQSHSTLTYFTNSTGVWTTEPIASVNTPNATIAIGPTGPAVFWAGGTESGVRRADLGESGWTTSILTTGPEQSARAVIDGSGVAHIATGRFVQHPTGLGLAAYLIAPDVKPPAIGKPRLILAKGRVIGDSTVPVTIQWSAGDAGSGLARYQLQGSKSGGSFSTISSTLIRNAATRTLASGTAYAYRVRGWDNEGLVSKYATGPTIRIQRYQETNSAITYTGSWTKTANAGYSGGSVRYSTSATAGASVTFTGRGFAWVASYGASRGSAQVIVDGIPIATVSTYQSTTKHRVIAYAIAWDAPGVHTVQIKPLHTPGHARVDVDAVLVVR